MQEKEDFRKRFLVSPNVKDTYRLGHLDTSFPSRRQRHDKAHASASTTHYAKRMATLQYELYAEGRQSLLIVLQGIDASGKDGTVRHVFGSMNPQGIDVACFKQPTPIELAHDFLWRIHPHTPGAGQVVVFNRSHYESVLIERVHDLVPRSVWSARYARINAFEENLTAQGTRILKFFLHISAQEQLARFKQRLEDPLRQWKISESDYTERERWPQYTRAYEQMLEKTSTEHAPWYVVPSDRKWFRNLAISQIVCQTLEDMKPGLPKVSVDLDEIRQRYHAQARG